MPDDDILSVAQVAAQFGVTAQTVRTWMHTGKLKAGRVGKSYVILRGDVYAMIETAAAEQQRAELELWTERTRELPAASPPDAPPRLRPSKGAAGALRPARSS